MSDFSRSKTYVLLVIGLSLVLLVLVIFIYVCYRHAERKKKELALSSNDRLAPSAKSLTFTYKTNVEPQQSDGYADNKEHSNLSTDIDLVQPVFHITSSPFVEIKLNLKDITCTSTISNSLGRLSTALYYDKTLEQLKVNVIQWYNTHTKNCKSRLSPYVKVCIVPDDKKRKYFTKTKKGENPIFDEEFTFPIPHIHLQDRLLHFSVCDFDKYSRQNILGNAVLNLKDFVDSLSSAEGTNELWVELTESDEANPHSKGEILYSLSYYPTAGRMTLGVIKAKDLNVEETDTGVSIKVSCICDGKIAKSRKTSLRLMDLHEPTFNESYVFDIPNNIIDHTSFLISVYAYSQSKKRIIGKCVTGSGRYSTGTGLTHWNEMLSQLKASILRWHKLT